MPASRNRTIWLSIDLIAPRAPSRQEKTVVFLLGVLGGLGATCRWGSTNGTEVELGEKISRFVKTLPGFGV
jgi:hypothetical protein